MGSNMKKLIILLIISLLFLSGCGIYNLNGFIMPDDLEFLAVVESLDTPEKISKYMKENFTYESHSFYIDPYTLWKIKKGDCNDFSTFATYIAHYHGYETWEIRIIYEKTSHRLGVYKEGNYLTFTSNQYYYTNYYNNFLNIVNSYCLSHNKVWKSYEVYKYNVEMIKEE